MFNKFLKLNAHHIFKPFVPMPYKPYPQNQGLNNNTIIHQNSSSINASTNLQHQQQHIMKQEGKQEDVAMEDSEDNIPNEDMKPFSTKFDGAYPKSKPIPNAVKKKRTNFRLRKVIVPKAPLMVLNEMVGSVNYTFLDTSSPMPNMGTVPMHLFTAQCVVDGETFTGTGPSKQIAKNICAEHAIQAVVVKKSKEAKIKEQTDSDGNPLKPNQMEDETPWAQLASLALFKLFNDWQAQGKTVPSDLWRVPDGKEKDIMDSESISIVGVTRTQKPAKKIPENPTDRHPVQLLNELRGGVLFNLISEVGTSPNITFTIGVDIDGKTFTGEGKTKKEAKKNCAIEVLKLVHNIVFSNLKSE